MLYKGSRITLGALAQKRASHTLSESHFYKQLLEKPPKKKHLPIENEKIRLRRIIGEYLGGIKPSDIQKQSLAVSQTLFSLPSFQQCKNVSCYLTGEVELETSEILKKIFATGKNLFLPQINSSSPGKMDFLQAYDLEHVKSLRLRQKASLLEYNGVKRVNALDTPSGLEMMLIPGVAFEPSMSVLESGPGYFFDRTKRLYGRYISSYIESGRPRPILVGLALRQQILDTDRLPAPSMEYEIDQNEDGNAKRSNSFFPRNKYEFRLDYIVTPDRVLPRMKHLRLNAGV